MIRRRSLQCSAYVLFPHACMPDRARPLKACTCLLQPHFSRSTHQRQCLLALLCTPPAGEDAGDDAGNEGCEDDGIEDAAAAAAKQAKQGGATAKRRKQGAASEEATLATAEQLRQKKVDNTFAVDPMFHKMSALFDEGGAKGRQEKHRQDCRSQL